MITPYVLTLEELQRRVVEGGFNRWLGLSVTALHEQGIELHMPWRDELIGNAATDHLHGGILGCLIDTAGSFSVIGRRGDTVATVDLRVDYHRPAARGALSVRAEIVKLGATLSTVDARVHDAQGQLVASGRGVFMARRRPTAT